MSTPTTKKIVIVLDGVGAYLTDVPEGEKDIATTTRIRLTLGHRNFRWYEYRKMLALPLKEMPATMKGFEAL